MFRSVTETFELDRDSRCYATKGCLQGELVKYEEGVVCGDIGKEIGLTRV